jgi:hypothetical protein
VSTRSTPPVRRAGRDRVASIDGHLELLAADVKDKMAERDLDLALGSDQQGMGVSTRP